MVHYKLYTCKFTWHCFAFMFPSRFKTAIDQSVIGICESGYQDSIDQTSLSQIFIYSKCVKMLPSLYMICFEELSLYNHT